jgi:hypothetical protein
MYRLRPLLNGFKQNATTLEIADSEAAGAELLGRISQHVTVK